MKRHTQCRQNSRCASVGLQTTQTSCNRDLHQTYINNTPFNIVASPCVRASMCEVEYCSHLGCTLFLTPIIVVVQRLNVPLNTFWGRFYRPGDQTNSVKALKETSWSWRSGLNPTRTTPPCYNNTTLGNHLYAQCKGPNVTNPICLTCKNCSYKCAADCEHCVTQSSTQQFW